MAHSTTRTTVRTLLAAGIAAAAALSPLAVGTAAAAPAAQQATPQGAPMPSSCRPANNRAVIAADHPSAGHRHYRVTITAAPGYEPCVLAGSPTDVQFRQGTGYAAVTATPYGPQDRAVTFGPGHPVHFDIQVPNTPGGARSQGIDYTLRAPGGEIPGSQSADGYLEVDAGTRIGPVQPGA